MLQPDCQLSLQGILKNVPSNYISAIVGAWVASRFVYKHLCMNLPIRLLPKGETLFTDHSLPLLTDPQASRPGPQKRGSLALQYVTWKPGGKVQECACRRIHGDCRYIDYRSKPMVPFWDGCTTHFSLFSGDWDVHWGCGLLTQGHFTPMHLSCAVNLMLSKSQMTSTLRYGISASEARDGCDSWALSRSFGGCFRHGATDVLETIDARRCAFDFGRPIVQARKAVLLRLPASQVSFFFFLKGLLSRDSDAL